MNKKYNQGENQNNPSQNYNNYNQDDLTNQQNYSNQNYGNYESQQGLNQQYQNYNNYNEQHNYSDNFENQQYTGQPYQNYNNQQYYMKKIRIMLMRISKGITNNIKIIIAIISNIKAITIRINRI